MVYVRQINNSNDIENFEWSEMELQEAELKITKAKEQLCTFLFKNPKYNVKELHAVYAMIDTDFERDIICYTIFYGATGIFIDDASYSDLQELNRVVYAIHNYNTACHLYNYDNSYEIRPLDFATANSFIEQHHRHNKSRKTHKFSIGAYVGNKLVGVSMVAPPNAKHLGRNSLHPDNPYSCEIVRLCTNGNRNLCSLLYSRSVKIAKEMGYDKVYTYILNSENGASLKASGFTLDAADCGTDKGKRSGKKYKNCDMTNPTELKQRWVYLINN